MPDSSAGSRQSSSDERVRVCLVKHESLFGALDVGAQYEATFPRSTPPDVARFQTFRKLKRDHPDENPMCWTVDRG
jgi:hypothetical protein